MYKKYLLLALVVLSSPVLIKGAEDQWSTGTGTSSGNTDADNSGSSSDSDTKSNESSD